ncbi:L,D-transpeptidase family protein [Herbidospora sp. NBRC 101105]|uniref:L,D-transpeptidase family protein n=1 Tax=Herbidospora sp. NBRC 101105 TaxID=3032195 RepID=UPI0025549B13|nr:L,D-transpeptidase family protein [Herbidospora sp. NBRC 101105]
MGAAVGAVPAGAAHADRGPHKVTHRHQADVPKPGTTSAANRRLQKELSALGYFTGPWNGYYGPDMAQAMFAVQKVNGLKTNARWSEEVDRKIRRGWVPVARSTSGNLVEVDLQRQLLMVVRGGKVVKVFNTSGGNGKPYGGGKIATTPRGVFTVQRQVNKVEKSPLGELYRPKYFHGGYAIHGSAYVPPRPASHGCVRVSYEAMNWLWKSGSLPVGGRVWIY